ncbi:MAG: hypothetical protein H6735_33385, partial [Alphaproteobacteria bacterium]|nr:hypothetical protein [Alphaproteobacteria bacterium]
MPNPLMSIALALVTPAHAFVPPDTVEVGMEPQRTWWRNVREQDRLSRESEPLTTFREANHGWKVAWDELARTPKYLWGPGIAVPTGDRQRLVDAVGRVLRENHALLGFDPSELVSIGAEYHEPSDTWYVDFDVDRDPGVPTYRAGISARVKHGKLMLVSVRTTPDAPVTGSYALSRRDAERLAVDLGPVPGALHTSGTVEPRLLELQTDDGLELRRAWMVRTRTEDPPGLWVAFVDAENGQLLSVHNEVRFLNGTVSGMHHERLLDGSPLVEDPIPLAIVVGGGGSNDITDEDGDFTVNAGTLRTDFDGDWLSIQREDGPNAALTGAGPDLLWTSADADQTEIDSWIFLHQVRDWGLSVDPTVRMMSVDLVSNVNVNQSCNAYYDGRSVNFFRSSNQCNNTGQIADIEYHEWGHGFHFYSIRSPGGIFDGSLSEGAADTVSVFMTGDHLIGPTFFRNGGAVRNVEPDKVYPRDFRNDERYVHDNGLIFGGTMWDLLQILQAEEGMTVGQHTTEQIFAGILRGGTDIPGTFFEALVSDDDDGDLTNGTPHQCEIVEAFGRHGLANGGEGGLAALHEQVPFQPADTRTDLSFQLQASECFSGRARTGTLHYRIGGKGTWKESEVDIEGSEVIGHVPGQDAGTFVEYWIDGVDTDGLPFTAPLSGQFAPYSFYAGDALEVGCETFEDNGGYTSKAVVGSADEWKWTSPKGGVGKPTTAFTGKKIWSTDPGGDDSDGMYEPNTTTRIRSGDLDTYHYTGVFLQYRRWLQVEDGGFDIASIEANGKKVWTNATGGDHQDWEWVSHVVDLDGRADQLSDFKLSFELAADGGVELGGWNIDDVCLMAPDTLENRLGVSHFTAIDLGGHVGLSWVNPRHDPATRMVVVRRGDRFPEGPEDGNVILDTSDFAIGATVQYVDPTAPGNKYYAAFATDGTDWTSVVSEGINAAVIYTDGVPGGEMVFG